MMTTFLKHKKQKPKTFLEVTLVSLLAASPLVAQADGNKEKNSPATVESLTKEVEMLKAQVKTLKGLIQTNSEKDKPSLTIGDHSSAIGPYSTAIGEFSNANGEAVMAIGTDAKANGINTSAIGPKAQALKNSASAIGANAQATHDSATAIGSNSVASGISSITVGVKAESAGYGAIAIGSESKSHGLESIALGYHPKVGSNATIAIGAYTLGNAKNSIVIGRHAATAKTYADLNEGKSHSITHSITKDMGGDIAIGLTSQAASGLGVAIGAGSAVGIVGDATGGIALGANAYTMGNGSISIGQSAGVTNAGYDGKIVENSIAIGHNAGVSYNTNNNITTYNGGKGIMSNNSIALGTNASVMGSSNGIAIGNQANIITTMNDIKGFIAIGDNASINLGNSAAADKKTYLATNDPNKFLNGAIALGKNSVANSLKEGAGYDPSTGKENANGTGADWTPTMGELSLGSDGTTRRIKHVAAGLADTDVVNVAQLKQLRFHYTVNEDKPHAIPLDKPLTFINGTNTSAKMDSDGKVHYDVNSDLKNITSISNGDGKGAQISLGSNDKNISVNNGKITNVADGNISATSKDAINGSQLEKYVAGKLKNLDVSNVVDKKLQNQKIAYKANGKDAKEVSLGMGFDFTNGHNTTASIGDNGKVIYDVNSDLKNITSISNGDGKGAKISLDTNDKNISVNGGKLTNVANGTISADSKDAINGSQLKKVEDEKLNIDGSNMQPDKQATFGSHVGIASLSNPQDANSSKLVQAKAVKNYVDDKLKNLDVGGAIDQKLQNQEIAYKANGEPAKKVKLGTGFDFTNGRNTTASVGDNGKVIYDVNQDLQEIHSISGASAGTGAKISLGTQDKNIAVNQGKITQLAAGEVSATSTDAVNGSQLYGVDKKVNLNTENIRKNNELINRGLGFAGNEGKGNQKLGSWMTIEGSQKAANTSYSSDNITTSYQQDAQGNGTLRIEMKDAPTFKALTVGQTAGDTVQIKPAEISVKAKNGKKVALTAQGLDNGGNVISNVGDGVAPTDAVNRRQLDNVAKRMGNIGDNINAQIHKVQKKANAGHAATMAAALLPQPFAAGRSMVGAAVGAYRDQQAVAIGVARTSDNGKWIVRAAVTEDTQNGVGGGASFGYQW